MTSYIEFGRKRIEGPLALIIGFGFLALIFLSGFAAGVLLS